MFHTCMRGCRRGNLSRVLLCPEWEDSCMKNKQEACWCGGGVTFVPLGAAAPPRVVPTYKAAGARRFGYKCVFKNFWSACFNHKITENITGSMLSQAFILFELGLQWFRNEDDSLEDFLCAWKWTAFAAKLSSEVSVLKNLLVYEFEKHKFVFSFSICVF